MSINRRTVLKGMLAGGTFVHGGRPEDAALEMDTYSQCCIAIDVQRFLPLEEVSNVSRRTWRR